MPLKSLRPAFDAFNPGFVHSSDTAISLDALVSASPTGIEIRQHGFE